MFLPSFLALALLAAQHTFTPDEIAEGGRLFQSNCASCHGSAGDQVPGVALMSGKFRRASTDDEAARIIRNGIAGTTMQSFNFTEQQAATVVAYLRSVAGTSTSAGDMPALGDASRGKAILEGKGECLSCHRVGENGSRVGPDLSSIGVPRRPAFAFGPPPPPPTPAAIVQQLERSLLAPDTEVAPANRTYRVALRDGTTLTGRLLNLDTFTMQLFDSKERLITLQRSDLREFTLLKSPMPSYRDKLTAQELSDLLAYLMSLKGQVKQ